MLTLLNIIVLGALLILLVIEEVRYRKFSHTVKETRAGLLSLAHQLRSPLAALKKYHAFLRGNEFGMLSLSQQEALSKIDYAFGETVVLVERLLARSRIEEMPISSSSITINVAESCAAAIAAVTPEGDARKHRIVFDSPLKKISARIDPLLFHGILDELLLNAIFYTPKNGIIRVGVQRGTSTVKISIRDNGIGIPEKEQKSIFQKYFRGIEARTMANGSGMGLSFAKSFAERSGGSLRCTSKEGKGSTFSVTLPLVKNTRI